MCRLRTNALNIWKRPTNCGAPNVCERLPKNAASKQKTTFWKEREAAFCEGSREAPGRLCKKLLPRSFLPTARSRFFCVRFFSFSYQLLAPWFEIIAPRALKKCVATTISKNKAHFLPPGVLSMVASRARSPGTFLSPRRHIFPDFWISCFRRCPYVFWFVVPYFFAHRADQFFRPGAIIFWSIWSPFLAQIDWMPLIFIHVFNVFLHFSGIALGPVNIFLSTWWPKSCNGGLIFDIFPHTFWLFWRPKNGSILLHFWQHLGPRGPLGYSMLRTPGGKKCVFILDLRNPTKLMTQQKNIFHRQTEMELGFRNPKPKCG